MSVILERIFALMNESGKSDYAIRKETGIKNSVISEWRAGRSNPSTNTIITLANYFNVSADYILGLSDEKTTLKKAVPMEQPKIDASLLSDEDLKEILASRDGLDFIEKIYVQLELKQKVFVLAWLANYAQTVRIPFVTK